MECLRDYITVSACGGNTSTSGLSLDVLELVNLKALASIADDQQETYNGVMSDVQSRALLRFHDDVRAMFGNKYKIKNLIKSFNLKRDNLDTSPTNADTYITRGIYISQNDDNVSMHKPFQTIKVQSVSYYADATDVGTVVALKIIDLDTAEALYTTDVTLVEGWNVINVESDLSGVYASNPQRVFIAIDSTSIKHYEKELTTTINGGSGCGLTIQGAKTTSSITSDIYHNELELGQTLSSMTAVVSLGCSFDSIVCANRELFKRAWLYCLGIEFCRELLTTDRLNKYSLLNKARATEVLERFTKDYQDALTQTIDGIELSQSGCCIECNAPITIKTAGGFYGV